VTTLGQDARYAVRFLRRSPGFTTVAALTIGLGIGANTAIFSVLYGVLLRPLGVPSSDRVVLLFQSSRAAVQSRTGTSPRVFDEWRQRARSFEAIASYSFDSVTLEGTPAEELGSTLVVSKEFFDVLQARPVVGRTFSAGDILPRRRSHAIVLSHALWQRRWAGDAAAIGRQVVIDGEPLTVIGVMPPNVDFPPQAVDAWILQDFDPQDRAWDRRLATIARLKPGVTARQAEDDMRIVSADVGQLMPEYRDWTATIVPLYEQLVGNTKPLLLVAFGAVGLVLLLTCANIANLLLSRAAARQPELALRAALGASRRRLVAQLLTESVVLALVGGVVSLLFATWGHALLLRLAPGILPRLQDIRLDLPILGFAAALSLLTGLAFGMAPALRVTGGAGVDVQQALKGGPSSARATGSRAHAAGSGLLVAQIAISVVLLCSGGLLLRSLVELQRVQPGFDPTRFAAARVFLDDNAYRGRDAIVQYYDQLLDRVRSIPGVRTAGAVTGLPMDPTGIDFASPYEQEGRTYAPAERPRADYRIITTGYLEAAGIRLLRGRPFLASDGRGTQAVALVNETMAREAWPGQDPIGKHLYFFFRGRILCEVVGLVSDVRFRGLDASYRPELYLPHAQVWFSSMTIAARTDADPATILEPLRRAVLAQDPNQPVHSVVTGARLVERSIAGDTFYTWLLGVFAVVAALVTAAGVYGVISYWVSVRTREIGVRLALGAQPRDVLARIVRYVGAVTLIGVAIGLAATLGATRLIRTMLFGVGPRDPVVLVGVTLLVGAVAIAASWVPAWRATRIDPIRALRE